ncbi:glycosidase [Mycolicibacterium obuense]|uniref:Glycosidase n=1 Tax=Mycolicibacterium obuense TaxID=1807 RepID=A0A4R5X2K7_9MYCO|nr:glycoside hydrolase family 130 protein [Mycolicibacterium obuense]TDL03161.1 glycosidase [Mycolicibacterium obuense]
MWAPTGLAHRAPQRLLPDTRRVISRLFVPGQEGFETQESRTGPVLQRILALSDEEVREALRDLVTHFAGRHRDLYDTWRIHADELADRLDSSHALSESRMLLLGATFTNEYAIEGAALCNPSMVAHPNQDGVAPGSLRFVMSVRGIGEGHRSSIGFRTGVVDARGSCTIDVPVAFASTGHFEHTLLDAEVLRAELRRRDCAGEATDYIFATLDQRFTPADLDERLDSLRAHMSTRGHAVGTIDSVREVAKRFYAIVFGASTTLSERVLWPAIDAESVGMEDARFVRFIDDAGEATYYATYTAYSGSVISQQLLQTEDFQTFTSTPMAGRAAANKGLALFPRLINGRFAAMSRSDRETNTVAFADHPAVWTSASPCQQPVETWETVQLGNCGPPIETDAGWLVLTHGVGPMRTYSIGAILLDLDDPTRVIGRLRRPLLAPADDERHGYVPNVVYSCGALVHAGTLVMPYGICDSAIGVATVPLQDLLDEMFSDGRVD